MTTAQVKEGSQILSPTVSEATVGDFLALLKPTLMSLAVFTGLVGMVVAPQPINPVIALVALVCLSVGAGAAGALNMWYDSDIDGSMKRTRNRPIPTGRVAPGEALGFGSVLSVGSVTTMALLVNYVAALLLALTIVFYIFVYTMWLKRRTVHNTVLGGVCGAFPPLIGWSAATGSVSLEPLVLSLLVFLWQPPHFWALSLFRSLDYEKVGIPMLPVVAGKSATRRQILIYSLATFPAALLPYVLGFAGEIYFAVALAASLMLVFYALRVWKTGRIADSAAAQQNETANSAEVMADHAARKLFRFSMLYLFTIFAVLLIEQGLGLDVRNWMMVWGQA